jgi:UDP-N-acetylglucosamine--dolichyl-phosphate N-acetylglucosaminephosphotransferase
MLYFVAIYALIIIVSAVTVNMLIPKMIPILQERGFVGKDMNKENKTKVIELGGIPIFIGFSFGTILAIFFATYIGFQIDLMPFIAGILTIILIGFIGTIDDIIGWKKGIRQWQHALFPVVAALPLMAVQVSNPPITIPFIGILPTEYLFPFGVISFGVIYSLILVPIGVTGASNATNMLAGLNGLEASLSSLILGTLAIVAFFNGKTEALIIALAMIGALLAFLKYNWYPAKIFGGDGLTLMSGASIAVVAILGDMEKLGILLLVLFFIELYIKSKTKFQGESFGIPKGKYLMAPEKKESLTHYFMFGKATEKKVVIRILSAQAIICIIVLIIAYLNSIMLF